MLVEKIKNLELFLVDLDGNYDFQNIWIKKHAGAVYTSVKFCEWNTMEISSKMQFLGK